MPQHRDPLSDFVDDGHRRSLRALFLDYRVTLAYSQYWRNRAPWEVPWRKCADSFFLFPVRGEVRVSFDTESAVIKPGEFLMIPEQTHHALALVEGWQTLEQIGLHCHIHDRWARPLLARLPTRFGRLPERASWLRALTELTAVTVTDPELAQSRGETVIKELLAWQFSRGTWLEPLPSAGDPRVSVVLDAMERDFGSSGLTVEKLAEMVRITPVRLRKLFHRETGTGPKRFLSTLRLRKAARTLRATNASIKEVAAASGFASDHYFHLAFRTAFHCTPSEYRSNPPVEI